MTQASGRTASQGERARRQLGERQPEQHVGGVSVVSVGRFRLLALRRTVRVLVGIGRFVLSFRLLFCLVGIGGLAFVFQPFLRLDVFQEASQVNINLDRLPLGAQVDGLSEETAVDHAARPPVNRVVRDLDARAALYRPTVVDGDHAPVIGATKYVSHEVRLRSDLFVDIMRRKRSQFVFRVLVFRLRCEDRPCDA